MSYILNIGLAREGKPNISGNEVYAALRALQFNIHGAATYSSDTEPTVVVEVLQDAWIVGASTAVLAQRLGQDCIGLYDTVTGKGELIGPRADKWGEFNPEYFLLLDGSRLSTKGE